MFHELELHQTLINEGKYAITGQPFAWDKLS